MAPTSNDPEDTSLTVADWRDIWETLAISFFIVSLLLFVYMKRRMCFEAFCCCYDYEETKVKMINSRISQWILWPHGRPQGDPEQGMGIELVDNTTRVTPNPNIVHVQPKPGGNSMAATGLGINLGHPRADPFADPQSSGALSREGDGEVFDADDLREYETIHPPQPTLARAHRLVDPPQPTLARGARVDEGEFEDIDLNSGRPAKQPRSSV